MSGWTDPKNWLMLGAGLVGIMWAGEVVSAAKPLKAESFAASGSSKTMKEKDAINALTTAQGKFMTVNFLKKDGTSRRMRCRTGVKRYVKGVGSPLGTAANRLQKYKLITVYDLDKAGYRSIPVDRVISVKAGGKTYNSKNPKGKQMSAEEYNSYNAEWVITNNATGETVILDDRKLYELYDMVPIASGPRLRRELQAMFDEAGADVTVEGDDRKNPLPYEEIYYDAEWEAVFDVYGRRGYFADLPDSLTDGLTDEEIEELIMEESDEPGWEEVDEMMLQGIEKHNAETFEATVVWDPQKQAFIPDPRWYDDLNPNYHMRMREWDEITKGMEPGSEEYDEVVREKYPDYASYVTTKKNPKVWVGPFHRWKNRGNQKAGRAILQALHWTLKKPHDGSSREDVEVFTVHDPSDIPDDIVVVSPEITFEAPYVGAGALMDIGKDTGLGSFSPSELATSSAIHGDFDQASLNYSGKQNLEVRAESDRDEDEEDYEQYLRLQGLCECTACGDIAEVSMGTTDKEGLYRCVTCVEVARPSITEEELVEDMDYLRGVY